MDSLDFTVTDDVATLTINRPAVRNAVDLDVLRRIHHALDAIEQSTEGPYSVIITGSNNTFCSGLDLHFVDLASERALQRAHSDIRHYLDPLIIRLHNFRIPIIAAVNGPAVGAGFSLALASDIIVAADSAFFRASFVHLGLVPDAGITYHLARRIGSGRALSTLMTSTAIDSTTALSWGLVSEVVPGADIAVRARSIAQALAAGPIHVLSQLRRLHAATFDHTLDEQMGDERRAQETALRGVECIEGVRAFLEKREPNFPARRTK